MDKVNQQIDALREALAKPQGASQSSAASETAAWQWRYVGETEWKTPSGGRKITDDELKRERPIEQRPLYADVPQGAWQPIETAPHEELVLLGWWYAPQMTSVPRWECETGMASHGFRRNGVSTMSRHGRATHWQPLPASPLPHPQRRDTH